MQLSVYFLKCKIVGEMQTCEMGNDLYFGLAIFQIVVSVPLIFFVDYLYIEANPFQLDVPYQYPFSRKPLLLYLLRLLLPIVSSSADYRKLCPWLVLLILLTIFGNEMILPLMNFEHKGQKFNFQIFSFSLWLAVCSCVNQVF
jgi:hypothetical protein